MNRRVHLACIFLVASFAIAADAPLAPRVIRTHFPTDDIVVALAVATESPRWGSCPARHSARICD